MGLIQPAKLVHRFIDLPDWYKAPEVDNHWTVWYRGRQVGGMFLGKSGRYYGFTDKAFFRSKDILVVESILAGAAVNGET